MEIIQRFENWAVQIGKIPVVFCTAPFVFKTVFKGLTFCLLFWVFGFPYEFPMYDNSDAEKRNTGYNIRLMRAILKINLVIS